MRDTVSDIDLKQRNPHIVSDIYLNAQHPPCRSRTGVLRWKHANDRDGICVFCDKKTDWDK